MVEESAEDAKIVGLIPGAAGNYAIAIKRFFP